MPNKTIITSYHGLDEQLQKLEQFDEIFVSEMRDSMHGAVIIAALQARHNAPRLSGELMDSISFGLLKSTSPSSVRGYIGPPKEVKAKVMEFGRWQRRGANPRYLKGKFFLYYAPKDKAAEIMALYAAANERIVNRLVVK